LRLFGKINSDLAIIIKNRDMPGQVSGMQLVGNVQNKHVIIIDDIIDTAGTLKKAV
jgi:ribose-phosphate pyrophosphokinase